MLLSSFLSLLFATQALGGQIPVVDGVIGGVPGPETSFVQQADSVRLTTQATTPGALRVTENSGVCARQSPSTAPLTLWFNGGPGSSSLIGLLQELGPCRITNDSTSVTLNPFSWNTNSNILFIDQPVGVGFSHGDMKVGTSQQAAADVWSFLQIFLKDSRFSGLASRDLAIWTESYGGHYGPTFAAYIFLSLYFLSQNALIASGEITGIPLNLKVLGVGDGLTDPLVQYPGYIEYAASNPYHPLVNQSVIDRANTSWLQAGGCRDQTTACYANGTDATCSAAQSFCNGRILNPLAGDFDVYYVLARDPDPYPPPLDTYLATVQEEIGAEVTWTKSNSRVHSNFAATGDWMRNSRPDLETVIDAGVRVIVYDGDADYILNFNGVEAMVDALNTQFTPLYKRQVFQNYTVNGELAGQFKNAGTFSYVRIYGAGHEVPAYKFGNLEVGEAALQMFDQIMRNESLTPT
ncbi:hypothetical protein V5O48_012347 [Marasmius crinis-equi]|uniref:Carboxypeptidase n=1 Tax=Marasmius crinis-equi TaxID=585013 RepID=A0ABR3F345_9AGAR